MEKNPKEQANKNAFNPPATAIAIVSGFLASS